MLRRVAFFVVALALFGAGASEAMAQGYRQGRGAYYRGNCPVWSASSTAVQGQYGCRWAAGGAAYGRGMQPGVARQGMYGPARLGRYQNEKI